uniref:Uncharacterized protein n=1 Tax=Apteryx owenii TaxID=8824 RepID=A0A8B9SBA2_APTOW
MWTSGLKEPCRYTSGKGERWDPSTPVCTSPRLNLVLLHLVDLNLRAQALGAAPSLAIPPHLPEHGDQVSGTPWVPGTGVTKPACTQAGSEQMHCRALPPAHCRVQRPMSDSPGASGSSGAGC